MSNATNIDTPSEGDLKKELGVFEISATGVGIILGAGIYVIIGKAAGLAGGAIWVPFLLAALSAGLTGMSYAELSSMYPKASASFEFANRAFGIRTAFLAGWLLLLANMISAGAVALGFAGYLSAFADLAVVPVALALVAASSVVLLIGVKETVWIGIVFTLIEVVGLVLVVAVSLRFIGDVSYLEAPEGIAGLFKATTLIFFAYLGFEQIASLGEEAQRPKRTIPLAILLAVALSTVLYVAVAISSVSALPWRDLALSDRPLADVVDAATGAEVSSVVGAIALFATANTVLFVLLASSRMMYGMSKSGVLPGALAAVRRGRGTPWRATLVAGAVAAGFTLIGDIEMVAQLTNFAVLAAFVIVNASLIRLRYKRPAVDRQFRVPMNIGRVPVPALLGLGFSIFMIINIGLTIVAYGTAVALLGVAIAFLVGDPGRSSQRASNAA